MDKLILITGAKRVGKDTFFNLLCRYYPKKFQRYAFADELKKDLDPISLKMFNKTVNQLNDFEKETFRPIMIAYGCAWREIDPLHWVKVIDYYIDYEIIFGSNDFYPVICDCRFPNEIDFFVNKYRESVVVEIEREGAPEPTGGEKKNIPLIKPLVNYSIKWPTILPEKELDELAPFVHDFYKKYFK